MPTGARYRYSLQAKLLEESLSAKNNSIVDMYQSADKRGLGFLLKLIIYRWLPNRKTRQNNKIVWITGASGCWQAIITNKWTKVPKSMQSHCQLDSEIRLKSPEWVFHTGQIHSHVISDRQCLAGYLPGTYTTYTIMRNLQNSEVYMKREGRSHQNILTLLYIYICCS